MSTILVTGGTGFIGKHLTKILIDNGYNVKILSRSTKIKQINNNIEFYNWDINNQFIEKGAFDNVSGIIHLAGENIGNKIWSIKRKKEIIESRINTIDLIYKECIKENKLPSVFISASAIGFYGAFTSEQIFTEESQASLDFLPQTCKLWEQASERFTEIGVRTVKIRTGLVLSQDSIALKKMIFPIKIGIGSAIGSGKQYISWIHIDDLCGIYIKALKDINIAGIYNAVSPEYITNKEFMQNIAKVLQKPFWSLNIPSIFMKILFGEMSSIILQGSRISNEKILKEGYIFKFLSLKNALVDILKK